MSYGKGSARRRENQNAVRQNWDRIDWCGSKTEPSRRRKPSLKRFAERVEK